MLLAHGIVQFCALGLSLAQTPVAGAPVDQAIECARDQGYTPAAPALPGGPGAPTTLPAAWAENAPPAAACYAEPVRKTFFAYLAEPEKVAGGGTEAKSPLRVSFFDHASGMVPKPAILPLSPEAGAPTGVSLALDDTGYVWVCASAPGHPSVLFKSAKPHDIIAFIRMAGPTLADARLYHAAGQGFILVGLRGEGGGTVPCFVSSADGATWPEPRPLAAIDSGYLLATGASKGKVGVALAVYPADKGPLAASNIYYVETPDAGKTWQSIRRAKLELPIRGNEGAVLACEYRAIGWVVQLKDLDIDANGRPLILYLAGRSGSAKPFPAYTWTTARWVGRGWETTGLITAAVPFDAGVIQLQPDRSWRLLTARNSPAPASPHEEVVMWSTDDQGRSWTKQASFRENAADRHALARPMPAAPDSLALWISGQPGGSAPGQLHLLGRNGDSLMLPASMTASEQKPQPAPAKHPSTQPQ